MKILLSVLLLLGSTTVAAQCSRPEAPELPDGATADLEAMVAGQKAVKTYVSGTEAYLECMNAALAERDMEGGEEPAEEQNARIEAHNAAVDEMEAVAASFNEEIAEYKAKSQ